MNQIKSFFLIVLLTPVVSFLVSTCFFLFQYLLFPKKPRSASIPGGLLLEPSTESEFATVLLISALTGVIVTIFISVFVLCLLGVSVLILQFAGYQSIPNFSIPVFSLLVGSATCSPFIFGESSAKLVTAEGLYELLGSFVVGALIGLFVMWSMKRFFYL